MSGAPRRWIRLDVDWEDSPWLDALDGTAAGCWPRVLCLMKRSGVGGAMRAPDLGVLARRWRVPREAIDALLAAAEQDGALVRTENGWAIPNWDRYQRPDMTASDRVKRYRAEKSRLSPLRRNTVNTGDDTPHAGVTRHATETLTLTETLTPTSTATSDRSRKKRASPTYTPEFLELWAIHRRGSKAEAFQAYQHATVRHAQMAEALTHYVREKVKPGFEGAHLFRWLRDERWDEYENGNGNGRSGNFATDADYEPGGIYYREPRNG